VGYREDVWEYFRRAYEPALGRLRQAASLASSPDGKRIVFAGRMLERLGGTPQPHLGIVDVATGSAHDLDTLPGSAMCPAWSPAGTLAYVSGGSRIVVGSDGLDASFDGAIEDLVWNADGRRLLVRVAGRGADASGAAGSGTVTARNGEDSWRPYVESGVAGDAWRRAYVVDAEDGTVVWRSPDGDNVWEAVWCGSEAIGAVVSSDPSESSWYSAEVVVYRLRDGTRRALHRGKEELGVPAASTDGRYLTVIEACCSDRTLVAGDITLLDAHDPAPQPCPIQTCGVDVTHAVWRDVHRLFFIGLRRLETVAGEYDVRKEAARELWSTSQSVGPDFPIAWPVGDGDAFVAVVDSYGSYQRIVRVENGAETTLCDLSHDGSAFVAQTGGTAQAITWNARDGIELDGILVLPAARRSPGPLPLVVNIHGGPVFSFRNEWSMHYYYVPVLAHHGYAVFNPNPRGSRGRGQVFARMVRGDMCGEDGHDVLRGVDALIERGIADPKRIALTGRSYGGYMSCWLVTQTQRFAAAMPMAPVTDNFSHHFTANIPEFNRRFLNDTPYRVTGKYAQRSPVFFADRVTTPTLSMAGGRDRCTPSGQAMEFHRAVAERGVPCELVIYPEEGHHVERLEAQADQVTRMLEWLDRFMG
jgi:dipeptidyl aminopeptidase/acylaminoacyl peptidase